jgi:hypothetical protein
MMISNMIRINPLIYNPNWICPKPGKAADHHATTHGLLKWM